MITAAMNNMGECLELRLMKCLVMAHNGLTQEAWTLSTSLLRDGVNSTQLLAVRAQILYLQGKKLINMNEILNNLIKSLIIMLYIYIYILYTTRYTTRSSLCLYPGTGTLSYVLCIVYTGTRNQNCKLDDFLQATSYKSRYSTVQDCVDIDIPAGYLVQYTDWYLVH